MLYSECMVQPDQNLEWLMVEVLLKTPDHSPLSIHEIVAEIKKIAPQVLSGKTPSKSLYSVIYRREKRRREFAEPNAFITFRKDMVSRYSINPKFDVRKAGGKIG